MISVTSPTKLLSKTHVLHRMRRAGHLCVPLLAAMSMHWHDAVAQNSRGPRVIAEPGQVVALPPPGTPSAMPLPAYDKDEDPRNEWSRKEFPQHGECRWLPTSWGGKPAQGARVTAPERQVIKADLTKVIEALKSAPVVNPPIGFCPMVVSAGSDDGLDLGVALRSSFMVANRMSKDYSRDRPGGALHYGELLHLIFNFNVIPGGSDVAEFTATDALGEFFSQTPPQFLMQGFPVFGGRQNIERQAQLLVIPVNNRPLYRPLGLARAIHWQLTEFDRELKQLQTSIDGARLEYEALFAPGAKADEERIIAKRIENQRARSPEEQARIRASRNAEVEARARTLRQRWDVAAAADHPFGVTMRRKEKAQTRLGKLSLADAQTPACLVRREEVYITPDISTVGDSACTFSLIERNPEYYDRTLPRTAIQLVTINRFPNAPPQGGLPGSRYRNFWANQHMMWGLDWQKFRRQTLNAPSPLDMKTVLPHLEAPSPHEVAVRSNDSAASPAPASQSRSNDSNVAMPAPDSDANIQTLLPIYRTDQLVEVRYAGMPGGRRDWITIAPSGAPENQYTEWTYLDGQKSGTHKFGRLLKPGEYEVRAFAISPTGKQELKARARFEVH